MIWNHSSRQYIKVAFRPMRCSVSNAMAYSQRNPFVSGHPLSRPVVSSFKRTIPTDLLSRCKGLVEGALKHLLELQRLTRRVRNRAERGLLLRPLRRFLNRRAFSSALRSVVCQQTGVLCQSAI